MVSGMILEFVVIGFIATAVLVAPLGLIAESLPAPPEFTAPGVAAAALVIILLLYFVGTLVHFATWWWWRRLFHRRWFSSWLDSSSGNLYFPLAEEAFHEESSTLSQTHTQRLPSRRKAGFILDWCRFYVFQCGASELQVQYLRQFHLYRIAYGPLSAALLACVVATALSIVALLSSGANLWMLLVPGLLVMIVTSVAGAHHRVGRMWKYLCYSASVVSRSTAVDLAGQHRDENG